MKVKKAYEIGEAAWIAGIGKTGSLTAGKVVANLNLAHAGYDPAIKHYIISVPTEIEPLLEVRTWDTMSQDPQGPVGLLREVFQNSDIMATNKKIAQSGYYHISDVDTEIMATDISHPAINVRANPTARKRYPRKKKQ